MEEFNLSKRLAYPSYFNRQFVAELVCSQKDVKEFIKKLKEATKEYSLYNGNDFVQLNPIINKLAGDKLKWTSIYSVAV